MTVKVERKVYAVFGRCGSWEEYMEWPVGVFTTEEKALLFVAKAEKRAEEIAAMPRGCRVESEFDPKMMRTFSAFEDAVTYKYYEMELKG